MKRWLSVFLAVCLFSSCFLFGTISDAASKKGVSRAIAIVFDNSGSMYRGANTMAWCRATYAMEVFASMLNPGDTLQIYPMHPIEVNGNTYTREKPFQITDASQSSLIREIYTPSADLTPIESIDSAAAGLKALSGGKKYLIILTDGTDFDKDGKGLGKDKTRAELDSRIQQCIGNGMTVMFLGVGTNPTMPATPESGSFMKKQASDSKDVLSMLTVMCNKIFGRDTLPKTRISGNNINFDISLKKLIVFVQGENISDLKVLNGSGAPVGTQTGSQQTKYGEKGSGNKKSEQEIDRSLQGMMVTYTDCASGNYTISYSGNATSIEIYYEPDADLEFVFTDAAGNNVDPNALYEGDYKVSFGMKDAKTGKLISSDLLGNPHYQGSYSINGKSVSITHDGYSGEVPVSLKMGDSFDAKLTVTYLSGYTISKDSSDFGWPEGGIQVAARPAGELTLNVSGGDSSYSLQKLEEGTPFLVKVFYKGNQLTGEELKQVSLTFENPSSGPVIKQEFADDHYKFTLQYRDPSNPKETTAGDFSVPLHVTYTEEGSSPAQTQGTLSYHIEDDFSPLEMEVFAPEDYIVISDLEKSKEITVKLTLDGRILTPEEFASVVLFVNTNGIEYVLTPDEQKSAYYIKLLPTDGIEEGDYDVDITAQYTDSIGRTTQVDDGTLITLSTMPLWMKCLIWILLLLLILFIIWRIMRMRVLPKRAKEQTSDCYMSVNGSNVTEGASFYARPVRKKMVVKVEYNGNVSGFNLNNISPGKDSYLSKPQKKRSILVNPTGITMLGDLRHVDVGGIGYVLDNASGRLVPEEENQQPFVIRNGATLTMDGRIEEGGRTRNFHAEIPLIFK